ncbi:MAG: DUF4149 domain-containing protein [Desulfobulbaceae bacterium]|nr:DUF4149 domain-containing protein [Desulfobulbaceae bacterium]
MLVFHRIINVCYTLLLGTTIGASFALGAFVAPSIFNSGIILGAELLDHYQEGLIMTEIFKRYCTLLNITVGSILVWECMKFFVFKKRDYFLVLSACVVTVTGLLFTSYFTPKIIEAQGGGPAATATEIFQTLHQASVTDFSFLLVALAVMLAKVSFNKESGHEELSG